MFRFPGTTTLAALAHDWPNAGAAVVTWLDTLYADEVLELKGDVPASIMRELQRRLQIANQGNI